MSVFLGRTATRPGHTTRLTRPGHTIRLSQNRNHEIPQKESYLRCTPSRGLRAPATKRSARRCVTTRIRLKPFPVQNPNRAFDVASSISLWMVLTFLLVGTIGMILCPSAVSEGRNRRLPAKSVEKKNYFWETDIIAKNSGNSLKEYDSLLGDFTAEKHGLEAALNCINWFKIILRRRSVSCPIDHSETTGDHKPTYDVDTGNKIPPPRCENSCDEGKLDGVWMFKKRMWRVALALVGDDTNAAIRKCPQAQALLERFADELARTNGYVHWYTCFIDIMNQLSNQALFVGRTCSLLQGRIRAGSHPATAAYNAFSKAYKNPTDHSSLKTFLTEWANLSMPVNRKQMLLEWFADILVQSNASYNKEYMPLISNLEELNGKKMLFDPYPDLNGLVSRRFCKGAEGRDIANAADAWETFGTCCKNPDDNSKSLEELEKQMKNISRRKRKILLEYFAIHLGTRNAVWKTHESLCNVLNELSQTKKPILKEKEGRVVFKKRP